MSSQLISKLKHKVVIVLRLLGLKSKLKKWPVLSLEETNRIKSSVRIIDTKTTLNTIREAIEKEKKGAYLRFGDGDINLMYGINDIYQQKDKSLSKEMKQAFLLSHGAIHKSLPIHSKQFGFEDGMNSKKHLLPDDLALKYISATHEFFVNEKVYSPVALHHLAIYDTNYCISFLKFLKSKNPIFVGNKDISPNIINKLFGKDTVGSPSINAFTEIDRIEADLEAILKANINAFRVVVIAMGCSGRVLQKRIIKKDYNVYLFDFGSLLDAFNGNQTRSWIKDASIENLQNILNEL
ncbi:GT-D fold domain-containing glycosyltransferase [Winogradskyella haliclonae]|nr:GT-D fold domain-containing glycosyltransferase [Winogradskyella haliclonae]